MRRLEDVRLHNTTGFFTHHGVVLMKQNFYAQLAPSATLGLLTLLLFATATPAAVQTYPGLIGIRIWETSGTTNPIFYLPNAPQVLAQLPGVLNGGNRDFVGAPAEFYDVFYSDANGNPNPLGDYFTTEARFNGQLGGGLNLAAVDMLLGNASNPMVCRADILSSWVGLGTNYLSGSEVLAVDPDLPTPATFTTMGNTAGTTQRLRVTVGWKKVLVPEPASAALTLGAIAGLALFRLRTRTGGEPSSPDS
jgi:hypothetical protein